MTAEDEVIHLRQTNTLLQEQVEVQRETIRAQQAQIAALTKQGCHPDSWFFIISRRPVDTRIANTTIPMANAAMIPQPMPNPNLNALRGFSAG